MKYSFLRFPGFKKKALTFSYDDGSIYDKRLVQIFNENGLKSTFNINSGLMETGDGWRMSLNEAVELYQSSEHEIAIHGLKHLSLFDIPEHCAIDEILQDKKNLERATDKIIRGMAYSYGTYNAKTIDLLRKLDICYARTVWQSENFDISDNFLELKPTCHHNNPKLFDLLDEFLADDTSGIFFKHGPKLFYVWGHSHEFHNDNNWAVMESFAQKAGNHKDVWYATNIEIFDYINAYKSLIWSTDATKIYNPTARNIFINYYGKETMIPAGEEVHF